MKEFTKEELAACNREDNSQIYVAHQGGVYDVSESKMWKKGRHMKRHQAGRDLTTDIQAAPHEPDVLERYPQVGILKKAPAVVSIRLWVISAVAFRMSRYPPEILTNFRGPSIIFLIPGLAFRIYQ